MTRNPDFEHALGAVEGFAGRILHHDTAPAPGPHTPTATTTTQENPVNVIFDLENDAKAFAAKFAAVDHDAVAMLDAVQGDPELMELFRVTASLAGAPGLPATLLSGITAALRAFAPS